MNDVGMYVWTSAFHSDPGPVRPVNEDSWLDASDIGLWVVADGMGGHEAGQMASRMIIDALETVPQPTSRDDLVEAVDRRLVMVNQRLREVAAEAYSGRIVGSTVAVLGAFEREGVCLWAGDSRIYLLRNGHLTQLTRDHSHVEDLIEQGLIARDQARDHRLSNLITRAVGATDELQLELRIEPLQDGDVFLLCTDGLNKVVADNEIRETLSGGDCEEMARALIHLALVRKVSDNVTVGIVHVRTVPSA